MDVFQSIIMGIVQGLTEFLPVSSSGHLVIFKNILGINLENGALFEVILHIGTLLAIILVYSKDVWMLIKEGIGFLIDIFIFIYYFITSLFNVESRDKVRNFKFVKSKDRKLVMLIIVASIPTAVIGLLFKDIIEETLMNSLFATGVALIITGCLLKMSQKLGSGSKRVAKASYKNATIIGIFQGIAITPGISRSGSTIVAGLLSGFDKEFAIKFSFLMSLPAVGGAGLLKLTQVSTDVLVTNFSVYFIGMLTSALVGFICIKTLLVMLKKNVFHYFAYYCLAIGVLSIVWDTFLLK